MNAAAAAQPVCQVKQINAALAVTGWAILDFTINTITGFARLTAERRGADGHGMKVILHRSAHGRDVLEVRDLIERKPGMYRDHWDVVGDGHMGRRRYTGFRSALRGLANYIDDNSAVVTAMVGRTSLRELAGALPAAI